MIKKIRGKKGANHVEFIISFVIFVSFVLIIFLIFNPFRKPTNTTLVDSVYLNLEDNQTTVLSAISIDVNLTKLNTPVPNCLAIPYISALNCSNGRNLIVKNISGDIILSGFDNIDTPTSIKFTNSPGNSFYSFYCADELFYSQVNLDSCQTLAKDTDYQLGILKERKVWARSRFQAFEREYRTDYPNLKKTIVTQGNDFGFLVTDVDNTLEINATSQRPLRGNVYAKTLPIDVIDENAVINKRVIIVMSW